MKMKILTISVFSILLLSSMIFSNYKHGNRSVYINVNSIVNDSLTLITKDSVFNFLKKKNVIKDSMLNLDVDLNKIENELKNIDYLKMSNAFYGINSPVVIQISERNPVIEIKNDNFYLDNEGIIISKSKINSPKVIAFFGNLDSLNNKKIARLGNTIMSDDFFKNHFNYVFSDSLEIYIKPKLNDYIIEFGLLDNIESKLTNYKLFYAAKSESNSIKEAEKINLKFTNQVIVQKK